MDNRGPDSGQKIVQCKTFRTPEIFDCLAKNPECKNGSPSGQSAPYRNIKSPIPGVVSAKKQSALTINRCLTAGGKTENCEFGEKLLSWKLKESDLY
jgi:hypothetical protein